MLDNRLIALDRMHCKQECPASSNSIFLSSQADIRESGTLTEHELSDAMRAVMGATPKASETSRVLRFFGEPGAEGEQGGEGKSTAELGGERKKGVGV